MAARRMSAGARNTSPSSGFTRRTRGGRLVVLSKVEGTGMLRVGHSSPVWISFDRGRIVSAGTVLTASRVVAAALWLERVCRVPPDASDDPNP